MTESISLVLYIYGLGIVIAFGAALLIKLIVAVLSYGEARSAATAATAPAAAIPPAAIAAADAIPEAHLVAIAAAAHAMLGAHRILHIGTGGTGPGWTSEGRLAQHSSHHPSHH